MRDRRRSLPLFPLNTVLFPNGSLPLQIFEERYKQMLRECANDDSMFGVSLIEDGPEVGGPATPCEIGTVAKIIQVNPVEGDRFFVSTIGVERFRSLRVTQWTPFIIAEVELFDDRATSADVPQDLVENAIDAFTDYAKSVAGLSGGWVSRTRAPSDPAALSYHIASFLQVDVSEKQRLLECETAESRLAAEIELLEPAYMAVRRQMTREMMNRFSRQ